MFKKLSKTEKSIVFSIPIIFLLGCIMHFLYDLSGKNHFVALFVPVNESVWEHLKMSFYPVVTVWYAYFIFKCKKYSINKNVYFTASLVSTLTSIMTVLLLYYFFAHALGIEYVIVDIIIYILGIMLGQILGLHFFHHSKEINLKIVMIVYILLIAVFMIFTYYTPQLPLFKDSQSGKYGI